METGCNFDTLVFEIQAGPIAVDGTYVYYVDYTHDAIERVPIGGGDPATLAPDGEEAEDIAVDATSLYWTTGHSPGGTTNKIALDGSTGPVAIATEDPSSDDYSFSIALEGGEVYWSTTRTVERAGLDGGGHETFTNYENGVSGLAVDATNIYWGDGNGQLKTIAK